MKKLFLFLAIATFFVACKDDDDKGVIPTPSSGELYYYVVGNTAQVTFPPADKSRYALKDVTIPAKVNIDGTEYNVVVSRSAFYNNDVLENLTLSEGLTSVDEFAFNGCSKLKAIHIPASLTTIDKSAFCRCDGVEAITVVSGNSVYEDASANAIINKSTHELFVGCSKTIIPTSVTSLGETAFAGQTALEYLLIPANVTKINNKAFDLCSGLAKKGIRFTATTPATFVERGGIVAGTPIYVPVGAKEAYKGIFKEDADTICERPFVLFASTEEVEGGKVVIRYSNNGTDPDTLVAHADDGYVFEKWSDELGTVDSIILPLTKDLLAVAPKFKRNDRHFITIKYDTTMGQVTIVDPLPDSLRQIKYDTVRGSSIITITDTVLLGQEVELTAVPNKDSVKFVGWSNKPVLRDTVVQKVKVVDNTTIVTANFGLLNKKVVLTFSVSPDPDYGEIIVSPAGEEDKTTGVVTWKEGTKLTLTVKEAKGCHFQHWADDAIDATGVNPREYVVPATDATLTAIMYKDPE